MPTNIYEHPTVSWDRARAAFERIQQREGELISAWVELGKQLNALRAKHQADQSFGAACQEHGIDLTRQHRNAAMWLAGLDADQLDSLRQYNPTAIHPKTLQDRCREQFPGWLNLARLGVPSGDTAEPGVTSDAETAETGDESAEATDSAERKNVDLGKEVPIPCMDNRNTLYRALGRNREKTEAIYQQWTCRATQAAFSRLASKSGSKNVLNRIIAMIPTHCRGPNSRDYQQKFSHRLFVPDIHTSWATKYGCDWTKPKAINAILDEIDDARRMVDELGEGRPLSDYTEWWENRHKKAPVTEGPNLAAFSQISDDKPRIRAAEGSEDQPIRAYGATIWPADDPPYTFDEAWAAYQLWKTEDQALATARGFESAGARGRHFMSQCDYLNRVSRGFVAAWRKIAAAQYGNPDQSDDCCCPHQHINIA